MQSKSESPSKISEFCTRTDGLASHYKIRVVDLPDRLKISEDMLMGYRTGRYPISAKAWGKLHNAEIEAGIISPDHDPRVVELSNVRAQLAAIDAAPLHAALDRIQEYVLTELAKVRARLPPRPPPSQNRSK